MFTERFSRVIFYLHLKIWVPFWLLPDVVIKNLILHYIFFIICLTISQILNFLIIKIWQLLNCVKSLEVWSSRVIDSFRIEILLLCWEIKILWRLKFGYLISKHCPTFFQSGNKFKILLSLSYLLFFYSNEITSSNL